MAQGRYGWSGPPSTDQVAGRDSLLTVGEVAATLRVSNMTVYRIIRSGQLRATRVGKNYRIRESDMTRYLSERRTQLAP